MTSVDTSHVDLESGHIHHHRPSSFDSDEGSCHSQFYSTIDTQSLPFTSDTENDVGLGSQRASSTAESECSLATPREREREKETERECRICQLSLEGDGDDECGVGIELGCSCKDDLAAAHKNCAEAWFKIKGNKTCEICNSIARNVFSTNEPELTQQISDPSVTTANAVPAEGPSLTESRSCINGHRFVNFLLACMVFIFIISWLFRFNTPS